MGSERIRLGISACLLGQPVRFDGGHKRDPFLVESLGPFVAWVSVCPEVESGMDAPRESMRLVQVHREIRLLTNRTGEDKTDTMLSYATRRVDTLADDELCGFVLKKDSPTCGLERVKVYGTGGVPARSGRGLFADALATRFPLLPLEEEGRLNDPRLRENFVERIFAYRALCFARSERNALPGFDQDGYVQAAGFESRTLKDLATEFELVRKSNVILFQSFTEEVWEKRGVANNAEVTVRSIPYIIAGHELHHVAILKERYLG
jgi:uncharacterized protein YbbK (DUF523 family)